MADITVGSRIICDENYGTVRYVGEVPPTKGLWFGVEWDDPSRGKHDGAHEGTRYFTTRHPTGGSFVRAKKVDPVRQTCYEALTDKYGMAEDGDTGINEEDLYVMGRSTKKIMVEMVGAEKVSKQQSHENLREVDLRDHKIVGAGPDGILQKAAPHITELDLSKNLLPSWEEVAKITSQFHCLEILHVSENLLEEPEDPASLSPALQTIRTIFYNRVQLQTEQLLRCSTMWPALRELHICFNSITVLDSLGTQFPALTLLNLEGNLLQDWEEVLKLGDMKSLETLIVNDTGLTRIAFKDTGVGEKSGLFPNLKSLSISRNKLENWGDINELDKLQNLEELECRSNPVLSQETDKMAVRLLLIARIGGLRTCNRSQVTVKERETAELDYIKKYGLVWLKAGGDPEPDKNKPTLDFQQTHPRFAELIAKYGAPNKMELEPVTTALKKALISVKIVCPSKGDKVYNKKLPGTMTVQKLKILIQRLVKVNITDQKLSYTSGKEDLEDNPEIELDNDMRDLTFYSIENGDIISVQVESS
ncbi:PREDICTED: tubulin-specific chaperone E-like [Branchiostoma belcheri]|uniref:Tubulin-specific chaperone E n=1 Tax=Branchiostoma belcheri TaxID=7741 RepID=A0A6P4ZAU3_BRABE|nr:PREDICTED: tubulin-specific chaperone E-like [Branchiostoma belcheri]